MDIVRLILLNMRLLEHLVSQVDELLGVQLLANLFILGHVVEQREYLLSACISSCVVLLLKLAVHEQVEHFAFVFHVLLVLGVLADSVQKGNNAFVKFDLVVVREVNHHRVVHCLSTVQSGMRSKLLDVHHICQAEQSVYVDAGLQILGQC